MLSFQSVGERRVIVGDERVDSFGGTAATCGVLQ
jgi:hypothetical protein